MPISALKRRVLTSLVSTIVVVLIADIGFTFFVIQDGMVDGFPLPPFQAITHIPRQTNFLEIMETPELQRDSIGGFDQHLGWNLRPNKASKDKSAHTNSMAARGRREYAQEKPAGISRIIAFGDSFVWCEEVPDKHAWEHIYEKLTPKTQVINFGVGGYGTDQAFLRYQQIGRELDADVVVIGLLLENIGRNVNRYRPLWSPTSSLTRTKPRFQIEGEELVLLPQPFENEADLLRAVRDDSVLDIVANGEYWKEPGVLTGRASSLMRLAMGWVAYKRRQPPAMWLAPDSEPYRVSVAILERFHKMAMADGAKFAPVLVFPAFEELQSILDGDGRYWLDMIADLESRGIPVLDLSVPLFERFEERAQDGSQRKLFSGYHLSYEGNRIVGKALHQMLTEQNLVPSKHE